MNSVFDSLLCAFNDTTRSVLYLVYLILKHTNEISGTLSWGSDELANVFNIWGIVKSLLKLLKQQKLLDFNCVSCLLNIVLQRRKIP